MTINGPTVIELLKLYCIMHNSMTIFQMGVRKKRPKTDKNLSPKEFSLARSGDIFSEFAVSF